MCIRDRVNTIVLLTSGLTVTLAHHALRENHRRALSFWLACTFLLGFSFVGLQAHEYGEAYRELGLRLTTGIYGTTFFMLTGFHGAHVTIGAIMLTIIWLRRYPGAARSWAGRSAGSLPCSSPPIRRWPYRDWY